MTNPSHSPSLQFMDDVAVSVAAALVELDRHESSFAAGRSETPAIGTVSLDALARLEGNLAGWQGILVEMADKVRIAQDELAVLDTDLKRWLVAFAAARKHLQTV
jgi:hypothetical protein